MLLKIIVFILIVPSFSFANSIYDRKLRNSNLTVKDYLIKKWIFEKKSNNNNKKLNGFGVTFFSKVYKEVKDESTKFYVSTRNCPKSYLSFKDDLKKKEFNKKYSKVKIKYKLKGRTCIISDWKIH